MLRPATLRQSLKSTTYDQAFVISISKKQADAFHRRNKKSLSLYKNQTFVWFPAANGYDQGVLNDFADLTGFPALNASKFNRGGAKLLGYNTPHHVGCFLSHWHLLRLTLSSWNTLTSRPKALWIMEDDAHCATNTRKEVRRILPLLPSDWDLFFIGGKPISYHTKDPLASSIITKRDIQQEFTRLEFREWACKGGFGRSATGPFAADGSRNLSLDQDYWQTKYITNTHAYIVNPDRIERVLRVLEHPTRDYQVPVDIAFAEAAQSGDLKVFMSTMDHCVQSQLDRTLTSRKRPTIWQGLYFHTDLKGRRVDDVFFSECPDKP
jgi:GR25 family glycosyltransferase involved in LPS biosynthesis